MTHDQSFWSGPAADWAVAFGTIILAAVAVFQQWLQQLIVRPRLHLNAQVKRPDAEKTRWNTGADVYYFRLAVTNDGNAAAHDVQVYLAAVERRRADHKYAAVEKFSPMNLLWAHLGQPTKSVLLPKMPPVYCDLAHISDPSKRPATQESLPEVTGTETVLGLDVEVKGFTRAHLLPHGTYRLYLKLAASNHPPRDYTVEIDFPGKWFDDEAKMFSDGFGMRVL